LGSLDDVLLLCGGHHAVCVYAISAELLFSLMLTSNLTHCTIKTSNNARQQQLIQSGRWSKGKASSNSSPKVSVCPISLPSMLTDEDDTNLIKNYLLMKTGFRTLSRQEIPMEVYHGASIARYIVSSACWSACTMHAMMRSISVKRKKTQSAYFVFPQFLDNHS
jgi:hypothetical protein